MGLLCKVIIVFAAIAEINESDAVRNYVGSGQISDCIFVCENQIL